MAPTTDHFSNQFKTAAERVVETKPDLWDGVRETLVYLRQFRRQAVAPDVRWGIAQSKFGADCGEVRWPYPEIQARHPTDAWRGLFVAHPDDDWYVFTILGNKAGVGNAWYSDAVVKSDEIVAVAVEQLGLQPFPKP